MSIRQEKYASLIQRDLSQLFQQNAATWCLGSMVSVTVVRVTSDLSIAKVYLSIFGAKDKEAAFREIQASKSQIKRELGNRIGKQVRVVPDLHFYIDDSLDYAEQIDELLNK